MVFLTVNLECSRSDCEALVNMLKILIKQLKLDREVCDVLVFVGGEGVMRGLTVNPSLMCGCTHQAIETWWGGV